ncbi:MAG: DNA replication/repair protein RecF [Povalibacter sp.]
MLQSVHVENFRCIEEAHLEFDALGTGILGANGSGKTSLLEAIFFLAHGRSVRTAVREKLRLEGRSFFRVVAHIDTPRGLLVAGTESGAGETTTRVGGEGVSSLSALAEILPIQLIDPGVHRLVEEGSARRRRLLDWGVFHVKPEFLGAWRRYQRALHQRNAALRSSQPPTVVRAWEAELAQHGFTVDRARAEYVDALRPLFERISEQLLPRGATCAYRRGWPQDEELGTALEARRGRDTLSKVTSVGAHRADLTFRWGDELARDRVSRGQQKLLACAFILAQVEFHARHSTVPTCLLLDDPAAELDVDNLGKLLGVISTTPAQLIVTSVSEAGLSGINIRKKFHVEQGRFAPML